MRKFLSIILVIAMLLSLSTGAFASSYPEQSNAVTLDSSFELTTSSTPFALTGYSDYETVKGVFGKDAGDESILVTESASSAYTYFQYNHGEPLYQENGVAFEDYVVIDFNFKIVDTSLKFIQVAVSNRQHTLSHQVGIGTSGYNSFGWNNMRVVYDPTDCADLSVYKDLSKGEEGAAPVGVKYGSVTTYLNGVDLGTKELTSTEEGWFNNGFNEILIQAVSGDKTTSHKVYYDDIKIYKSEYNEAPYLPYVEDGDTYTVSGNTVFLNEATTSADVISNLVDYSSVKIYTNDTLTTESTSSQLADGNVIVAKGTDDQSVYAYFAVKEADDSGINYLVNCSDGSTTGLSVLKFNTSKATAVGGKSVSDSSIQLDSVTTAELSSYDGNGYLAYNYTKSADYLVMEFNYLPTDSVSANMFILTNTNATLTGNYTLNTGVWSKVFAYVDLTGDSAVSHMFINGNRVSAEEGVATSFGDGKQIRIGCYGTKEGAYHTSYIDDLKIYEATEAPADNSALALLADNDDISMDGNTITIKAGTDASVLAPVNSADTVRAYTNSQFTALTDELFGGCVVVVENKENKSLNYYNVVVEQDSSVIFSADYFGEFDRTTVRGSVSENFGLAGKTADDSMIKLVQNRVVDNGGYNMYYDISWGESTSLDYWDKSDYTGYLVYELSVYNKSFNSIYLATDQNTGISNSVSASSLESERWNKLAFVLDYSGGETDGTSFVYVNGKKIDEGRSTSALGSAYGTSRLKNTLRLMLIGPNATKDEDGNIINTPEDTGTLYLDNIHVYETTVMPDLAVPSISSEFIDVNGRFVTGNGVCGSDISTDCAIRVYSDTTFGTLVDNSAVITEGNMVVIEDAKGFINYYLAEEWDGITIITDKMPSSFVRGGVESVPGFAGKDSSDTVYKITRTNASDSSIFSSDTWSGSKAHEDSSYMVFETNIMPIGDKNNSVHFATAQHQPIGHRVFVENCSLFNDRWNKLVAIYNFETKMVDTYVNGVLVGENEQTVFGNDGYKAIRLVIYLEVDEFVYADDFRIYESVDYPEVDLAPERAEGIGEDYITTNDLVYTTAGTTVAEIKALYTLDADESIKVYSGIDLAAELEDSAAVCEGAVVYITAPGENYYYNIVRVIDSIPVPQAGKLTILGDASDEFTIITKAEEGNLLTVKQNNNLGYHVSTKHLDFVNGDVVLSFHPSYVHGEIKAFVIEGTDTMKPVDTALVLPCTLGEAAVEEE